MLLYLAELVLIIGYYFCQILQMAFARTRSLASYEQFIALGFFLVICLIAWFLYKKRLKSSVFLQKQIEKEYAPVIAHLGIYGVLFLSNSLFETNIIYTGASSADLDFAPGMPFLNDSFIFILALAAAFCIPIMQKSAFAAKYLQRKQMAWLIMISLYSSFACFGERLFFKESARLDTLILFLLGSMWLFPLLLQVLCLYEAVAAKFNSVRYEALASTRKIWLILFCIFAGVWFIYLIACNPANMFSDSYAMWKEAISGEKIGYPEFPSIYIIFARILSSIIPHPSILALSQILLMAWLCASFSLHIYKKGVPKKFLYVFAFIWAALPANGLMMATLGSDIPFTMALLLLTMGILEIIDSGKINIWTLCKVSLALPLVFTMRYTGFIPAIFSAAFLIIVAFWKRFKPKLFASVLMGMVLVIVVQGPLYQAMTITRSTSGFIASAAFFPYTDIQMVAQYGGALDAETQENVRNYFTAKNRGMHPTDSLGLVMRNYLKTFAREPFLLIKSRLYNADAVWNVTAPEGRQYVRCIFYAANSEEFGLKHQKNILSILLGRVVYVASVLITPLDVILYRPGIYIVFSLLLCVYICTNKIKKLLALFLPMLGNIVALLLVMLWPVFRVVWFVPVTFVFICLYVLSNKERNASERDIF